MPVYGTEVELAICFQNSYGTIADITNSAQSVAFVSESINGDQPLMMSEGIRGRVDRGDAYAGAKQVAGDIEVEVVADTAVYLIASVLANTSTSNSDSMYDRNFKPRTADNQALSPNRPITLVKKWGTGSNDRVNYYNLNATGFELSCEAGDFLKLKLPLVGGRNDNGNTNHTASYPTGAPFKWDDAEISIDGNNLDNVKSFSLTLDEAIEPKYTLESGEDQWPSRIVRNGFRTGTLNMTLSFDNSSEYIAFRGDNFTDKPGSQQVIFNFLSDTEVQSGYNYQFYVDLPSVVIESFEAPVGGVGEVEATLTGRIKYNSGSGTALEITTRDSVSSV
jgi:hypothetical protein